MIVTPIRLDWRYVLLPALLAVLVPQSAAGDLDNRIYGMLVGSVIGDAAGGPVEFVSRQEVGDRLPGYRDRRDVLVQEEDLLRLAGSIPLLAYSPMRPGQESYGQWSSDSPRGTCTDDTRHKIVLIDALRSALGSKQKRLTRQNLAKAYLAFADRPEVIDKWPVLCKEGFREFCYAAQWELGERNPEIALPPSRMWNGVGTCCGMMTMPPYAGLFAGKPREAYESTYELSFFDNGDGKDINAAIVAGLAFALTQPAPDRSRESRFEAWNRVLDKMAEVDPYRHEEIKFMGRVVSKCIESGRKAGRDAGSSPSELYRQIKSRSRHRYAWEAQFLLHQAAALGEFCHGEPVAAMHLALDYGEDTDSIAQLLGAIGGAIHGPDIFEEEMREAVEARLAEDHNESLKEWVAVIRSARESFAETNAK